MNVDAISICTKTILQHSKSFSFASKLLPPREREEAVVLYHWCRRADDMVDAPECDPAEGVAKLYQELGHMYAGKHQGDIALEAMQQIVELRGIPRHYPEELIAGMAMDAEGTSYHTMDDLMLYCYRVAGTVGLMMSHVLGVSSRTALRHAAHMGMAMQLTNIARDVLEDWGRGRIYLPLELLEEAGAGGLDQYLGQPLPERFRHSLAAITQGLIIEAKRYYRSGDQGLENLSWRSAMAVRTARFVYSGIGESLARKQFDVFSGRARVSGSRKIVLGGKAAVAALGEMPGRVANRFDPVNLGAVIRFPQDVLPCSLAQQPFTSMG